MSTRKPQILKGFRDYTPEMMRLRLQVIGIFREVFEAHGYEPLDTPALEYMEVLTGQAGENEKLMYHFLDQGERQIGLRYDLTVPLARYVAMHQQESVLPFKRYHIAPVWRAEKPQRGRFREFWQCDADIVGSSSMLADAEGISVLSEALRRINMPNAVILINHRKLLEAMALLAGVPSELAPSVFRAIDKLGKIGGGGVRAELEKAGVTAEAAARVVELVSQTGTNGELLAAAESELRDIEGGPEAVDELRQLVVALASLAVPAESWRIDLSLARGIDYYTGPVFEAVVEEPKVGSIAGGGRYDGLIGSFLGRETPAAGISLGLERILEVVTELQLLPPITSVAEVIVATFPDTLAANGRIAAQLRESGIRTDLSILANRGLGDQMKYGARRGIPWAVIAGDSDLARGVVQIRNLLTGEQTEVPESALIDEVKLRLSS